ncbi:hypothetical protein PsYK624_134200 [Phanerochaete sordida]|uniref:Sensitive to high expression protein 9, mitochondrial n=1 Tax=Phanerochaete sordida TaxID=48140 RepID=A0A9P3GKK0_9APHY|nr:hypothetical protein PsYK624_134200 [Phanerochaete sordida]
MLRYSLSRPSLLRYRSTTLKTNHATLPYRLTALRRAYSTPSDTSPSPQATSSRSASRPTQPVIELSSPQQTEPPQSSSAEIPPSPARATLPSDTPNNARTSSESTETVHPPPDKPVPLANVIDVEQVKEKLRTWAENAVVTVRDRADGYTAAAATTFAQLGRELNKVTGYGEIESLKRQVTEQEQRIRAVREAAREAKAALDRAVQQRAKSQRDVNDLLQRKSSWTDEDVGRFTALVRQDHLFEQEETRAKAEALKTEEEVEREFTELMRVILNRYHEEQVWSDKIRSASTYGSLTVLGLNMAVFILAIIVVEPWKRRRLAQTFERKVEEMSAETIGTFDMKHEEVSQQLKNQEKILCQLIEAVSYSLRPTSALIPQSSHQEDPDPTVSLSAKQQQFKLVEISHGQLWAMAASAAVAGSLGWVLGSWFMS